MKSPPEDKLLKFCRSGRPNQQFKAIEALRESGSRTAAQAVADLLSSPHAMVREAAAEALGMVGLHHEDIVGPALINALTDPFFLVRVQAADSLGILRISLASGPLQKALLEDPSWTVRTSAAEALGSIGDLSSLPTLISALKDAHAIVRSYVADALGLVGGTALIPILQAHLQTEDSNLVRAALFAAMYRLGNASSLQLVLDLLRLSLQSKDSDLEYDDEVTPIVNQLEDLTQHKVPPTLAADAPRVKRALREVASNRPLEARHIQDIISRLEKLEGNERAQTDGSDSPHEDNM